MPDEYRETSGATYGGATGGAYGGPYGFTYGEAADSAYRIRLSHDSGAETIIDEILSVDVVFNHSGVSDCEVEIPYTPSLDQWRFARLELLYGDQILMEAIAEEVPGPTTADTARIGGRGPLRKLARGDIPERTVSGPADEVIREYWADFTEFDADVIAPETPPLLDGLEVSGTPLEVLQSLHEAAGMRFVFLHTDRSRDVESFPPSEVPRQPSWFSIDHDSNIDAHSYANRVVVVGGEKEDGTRARGTAQDSEAIARFEELTGRSDGTVTWRYPAPALTTDEACAERAQTVLEDRVAADSLSGTVDIIPDTIILPGYHYEIPEFRQSADAEAPVLPVNEVSISEDLAGSGASAQLNVNAPKGLADIVGQQLSGPLIPP